MGTEMGHRQYHFMDANGLAAGGKGESFDRTYILSHECLYLFVGGTEALPHVIG